MVEKLELVTKTFKNKVTARAVAFWSDEHVIASAPAIPMPVRGEGERTDAAEARATAFSNSSEVSAPEKRRGQAPAFFADTSTVASGACAPNTKRVANVNQYPYSAVGKLLMQFPNGSFVGSAWVIGHKTIFTAAHCLYGAPNDLGWADSVVFVPSYDGDATGLERWTVVDSAVHPNYAAGGLEWDFGVSILDRPISPKTGYLGYDTTRPSGNATGLGYPAQIRTFPFDGKYMWQSEGRLLPLEFGFQPMCSHLTGGSSGGPMIDGEDIAIGLNSNVDVPHRNIMYSPVFDSDFLQMVQWAIDKGGM